MRARLLVPLLFFLGACVSSMPAPQNGPCDDSDDCRGDLICISSKCKQPCDPDTCGLYGCDSSSNTCSDSCEEDSDCNEDIASCRFGECESLCEQLSCDPGFLCNEETATCFEFCSSSDECANSYSCCTDERVDDGDCDASDLNNCVR